MSRRYRRLLTQRPLLQGRNSILQTRFLPAVHLQESGPIAGCIASAGAQREPATNHLSPATIVLQRDVRTPSPVPGAARLARLSQTSTLSACHARPPQYPARCRLGGEEQSLPPYPHIPHETATVPVRASQRRQIPLYRSGSLAGRHPAPVPRLHTGPRPLSAKR